MYVYVYMYVLASWVVSAVKIGTQCCGTYATTDMFPAEPMDRMECVLEYLN